MEELNELGILLKKRIERKRKQLDAAIATRCWVKCIEIEATIDTLELVWIDLMGKSLLTK